MPRVQLLLLASLATAHAADGDGVRLSMSGSATPYARVEFALVEKRGTVVAEVVKTFAAGFGREERVGLVPRDEYRATFAALAGMGVFTLPTATGRPDSGVTWTVEARRGATVHTFSVDDPQLKRDARYADVLAKVRAVVTGHAGQIPFRDRMLLPSEAGLLEVKATPRARVWLDGVEQVGWTPLKARVAGGGHRIRLVSEAGLTRDYEVKVDVGRTTSLSVELK